MDIKKYDKVKIENFSKLFFQLGLTLALAIVYLSLEHKVKERSISELIGLVNQEEMVEDIPITERVQQIKPPPPPPPAPEVIEIVEDMSEIEETILESTETDQDEAIDVVEIDQINEIVEEEDIPDDVPFSIIEEAPIYPGCTGSKAERKQCLQDKIRMHVARNFDVNLAQELGLPPGRKKVFVVFKINHKGDISNIQVRGPHARLEKEAVNTIQKLPKMIPAKQRGRAVGIRYSLPITLDVRI